MNQAQLTSFPETRDPDYWLRHCEGYRVDSAGGRVGFVDEVRDADGDAPVLVVRAGLLGRRLLLFALDDVARIVPRARRLALGHGAQPVGTEISWFLAVAD